MLEHTKPKINKLLSSARLFRGFGAKELSELISLIEPVKCTALRGALITDVDEKAEYLGIVIDGRIREQRSDKGTKIHILDHYSRGALFGLDALFSGPGTSPVEMYAETDCEWMRFSIASLLTDDRYKERIKDNIMVILANNSIRSKLRMDVLLAATTREKAMTFFMAMRDKHESDCFQVVMTQTQMAEFFGVNRSALSRELNKMQREGILAILPNRRYHIMRWNIEPPDTRRKKQIACETDDDITPC